MSKGIVSSCAYNWIPPSFSHHCHVEVIGDCPDVDEDTITEFDSEYSAEITNCEYGAAAYVQDSDGSWFKNIHCLRCNRRHGKYRCGSFEDKYNQCKS